MLHTSLRSASLWAPAGLYFCFAHAHGTCNHTSNRHSHAHAHLILHHHSMEEHKDTDLTRIQAVMRYLTRACGSHRGKMGRVCRRGQGMRRRAAPWQKCSKVSARVSFTIRLRPR